jgi:hypothetical protein
MGRLAILVAIARTAQLDRVLLHHLTQCTHASRQPEAFEARSDLLPGRGDRRLWHAVRCLSTLVHGVVLRCGFDTPSLPAQGGQRRSAEQAARDAIEAGKLLIEAKQELTHGQWEAWLRDHATISPRTARRYMRIAASGLEIGQVADLGLVAAARGVTREQVAIARIRRHARSAWQNIVEAGRQYDAVLQEIGEDQFRAWARTETGLIADEALFLAQTAPVTDADGDLAALIARDDVPKQLHLPALTEAEIADLRDQLKREMDPDNAEGEIYSPAFAEAE